MNLTKGFFQWLRSFCWLVPRCKIIFIFMMRIVLIMKTLMMMLMIMISVMMITMIMMIMIKCLACTGGHFEWGRLHSCVLCCTWPAPSGHHHHNCYHLHQRHHPKVNTIFIVTTIIGVIIICMEKFVPDRDTIVSIKKNLTNQRQWVEGHN